MHVEISVPGVCLDKILEQFKEVDDRLVAMMANFEKMERKVGTLSLSACGGSEVPKQDWACAQD